MCHKTPILIIITILVPLCLDTGSCTIVFYATVNLSDHKCAKIMEIGSLVPRFPRLSSRTPEMSPSSVHKVEHIAEK